MSTPVIEYIADNILDSVNEITTANGFNQTLTAIRPRRVDFNSPWGDLTALVVQVEAEELDEAIGCRSWMQFFVVMVIVIDSDDSEVTIDSRLNTVRADVEKKIMTDPTRGGYAIDTEMDSSTFFDADDGGPGGVAVKFGVHYRTKIDDPYTRM